MNKSESLLRIEEISNLPKNWDGYGSIKVLPMVVKVVREFINLFDVDISDIYPNPHGTIQLEFGELDNKLSLEIGVSNYSYFMMKNKNVRFVNGINILSDIESLKLKLNELWLK